MRFAQTLCRAATTVICVATIGCERSAMEEGTAASGEKTSIPEYKVDPFWPKPLPNNWLISEIAGLAVDSRDHVWAFQRPGRLSEEELGAAQDPPISICCKPAPWILEFDPESNVVQSWGGPGPGYDWPEVEHGLFVDHENNVWIGGEGLDDHQVLKFNSEGTFLLQIGQAGKTGGNDHTKFLGNPTDMEVDPQTNEVYIADGYLNRRVIVFDAETGEYKRHWGAYGNKPEDFEPGIYYDGGKYMKAGPDGEPTDPGLFPPIAPGRRAPGSETTYSPNDPPSQQFNIVHALRITHDGLVYVADRTNNRIQVFQKDGTFVKEVIIAKKTRGDGSTWDVDVSPDEKQTFLYVADGINQQVWILRREDLEIVGSFGRRGHGAGEFHWLHRVAVDSQGNLYTGEVSRGRRLQKWVLEDEPVTE